MTTTALMADAVTVANLPKGWAFYAGYLNGSWANFTQIKAAHPDAHVFDITVNHTTRATVADVETGDLTPASGVLWARDTMHDVPNDQLVIYANTSTWPKVVAAFKAAGVALPLWWAANYSNGPHIPAGAIGIQYADGPYDTSLIVPALWPGIPEVPTVSTPTAAQNAAAVWHTDFIPAPPSAPDAKTNPTWQPESYLTGIYNHVLAAEAALATLTTQVTALTAKVTALEALTLTDAQVAALATTLGPALADVLAKRLAS